MYNTILRRFPAHEFDRFKGGGNLFATTICVLQSAVMKTARVMRLPPGLELFRGLGGLAELPDSFSTPDEHGCLGYTEYGFLSTTSNRETAVEYSGAGEGKPLPMVIQTRASSIDRGACIKDLSQYPGEVKAESSAQLLALRCVFVCADLCAALGYWAHLGAARCRTDEAASRWSTSGRQAPSSSRAGRRTRWRAWGGC